MRKLVVFNTVTLDGYFTGENGDLSEKLPLKLTKTRAFNNGNIWSCYQL